MGLPLIAMTGNQNSTLARAGDVFLDISIKEEACPLQLAPTASTTATLAMGDALAVALLLQRGFKEEDFALYHPGGALGDRSCELPPWSLQPSTGGRGSWFGYGPGCGPGAGYFDG